MEKNISEVIKGKRVEKGMTQEQLASAVDCTAATVANWENERSIPSLVNLKILMPVLGITREELLDILNHDCDDDVEPKIQAPGLNPICDSGEKVKYPFLPSALLWLKFSHEELEVLYEMECLVLSGENKALTYGDYKRILGSGRDIPYVKQKIARTLYYIDLSTLLKFIRKKRLDTFNIQALSDDDIYQIMKPYKDALLALDKYNIKLTYENYTTWERKKQYAPGTDLVNDVDFSSFWHRKIKERFAAEVFHEYIDDTWCSESGDYWKCPDDENKDDKDALDAPRFFHPDFPDKMLVYRLNFNGVMLMDFFSNHERIKKYKESFASNSVSRILKPHLGQKITAFATLSCVGDDGSLDFKSVYLGDGHKVMESLRIDNTTGCSFGMLGIVRDSVSVKKYMAVGDVYRLDGIIKSVSSSGCDIDVRSITDWKFHGCRRVIYGSWMAKNDETNMKGGEIMSKGHGVSGHTHTQGQLNHYANQNNPNNSAYQSRMDNHANQCNPNHGSGSDSKSSGK